MRDALKLNVYSIFQSIDGEVNYGHQGCFTTFVRLAGCNIKCAYCDTEYAQQASSGKTMGIEEIVKQIRVLGGERGKKVTITGGEPLLQQQNLYFLVKQLDAYGYTVTIETNGTIKPSAGLLSLAYFVVDFKLPSANIFQKGQLEGREFDYQYIQKNSYFEDLCVDDCIKFVILDKHDFVCAVKVKRMAQKNGTNVRFAFSPVSGQCEPTELIEWIKEIQEFDVILNLQLHKIIYPDVTHEV